MSERRVGERMITEAPRGAVGGGDVRATISLSRPLVSFCFDDFPHSALRVGSRLLEALGARATYYASVRFLDAPTPMGVSREPSQWSRQPEFLEQVVGLALDSGPTVLPVGTALVLATPVPA